MNIAKILNWVAIVLWFAGRDPTMVPALVAVLPFALALISFRRDSTNAEKWAAFAANLATVIYYGWVVLIDVSGNEPSAFWAVAMVVGYNIVPCTINLIVMFGDKPDPYTISSQSVG